MYYLLINGQKSGPYSATEVAQFLRQGAIGYETQFWQDGMMNWNTIGAARNLFEPVQTQYQQPPFQNPQQQNYYQPAPMMVQPPISYNPAAKSRVAYILLGLFLGGLGVHNFYAGYTSKAVTQLLLTLLLFWTIVVPIGVSIWIIIEVITIDTDAYGNRMTS